MEAYIESEVTKFHLLGRDFYNYTNKYNVQNESDLRAYIRTKSKPFFEIRDYRHFDYQKEHKYYLEFRIYAKNPIQLKQIQKILNEHFKSHRSEIEITANKINYVIQPAKANIKKRDTSESPNPPKEKNSANYIEKRK